MIAAQYMLLFSGKEQFGISCGVTDRSDDDTVGFVAGESQVLVLLACNTWVNKIMLCTIHTGLKTR